MRGIFTALIVVFALAGCAKSDHTQPPCQAEKTFMADGTAYSIGPDNKAVVYHKDGTAYGAQPVLCTAGGEPLNQ